MKKLAIFMVFVFVICVFTGCNPVAPVDDEENSTEEKEQTSLYESYTDYNADITLPEGIGFSWHKKPFLRATDIRPVKNELYRGLIYSYTPTDYGYHPAQHVAYYIDGKCGVADSYGKILCDALYTDPNFCPEPDSVAFNEHTLAYHFEMGEVGISGGHGGGIDYLCYDINTDEYICISGSEGDNEALEYDKTEAYIVYEAYMNKYMDKLQGAYYDAYEITKTGKLGLYYNGKLVIPFEYVAASEICEDVVAMYDGSMWTYFTVDGEIIMSDVPTTDDTFKYYQFTYDEDGKITTDTQFSEVNTVYSYSEGKVPVKKNEKWGYMDKSGNMITDTVFDNALPSFEGRAWVCVDGYWGIITI